MSADLSTIFADALKAQPVRRGEASAGVANWRGTLFVVAGIGFRHAHPEWLAWLKDQERQIREAYPRDSKAQWEASRPARRLLLAKALWWYRRHTPIAQRPSVARHLAREGELRRGFGED